jgi:hypothetical protein
MAHGDSYTIGEVEDRQILERKIHIVEGPQVSLGRKSYAPINIVGMWSRTRYTDWQLLSLSFTGERLVRDERGRPERRPEEQETYRFPQVGFAPTWMQSAVKSLKPAKDGSATARR